MNYLLFRISLKREEIKMESKGKTKFHKYYTFQKLTIISIATEIVTTLTNVVSNLLKKNLGNNCTREFMMQSPKNQCKAIMEIDFG